MEGSTTTTAIDIAIQHEKGLGLVVRLHVVVVVRGQEVQILGLARLFEADQILHFVAARLVVAGETIIEAVVVFRTGLLLVLPAVDQIVQVGVEMLDLLTELLDVLGCIFALI